MCSKNTQTLPKKAEGKQKRRRRVISESLERLVRGTKPVVKLFEELGIQVPAWSSDLPR